MNLALEEASVSRYNIWRSAFALRWFAQKNVFVFYSYRTLSIGVYQRLSLPFHLKNLRDVAVLPRARLKKEQRGAGQPGRWNSPTGMEEDFQTLQFGAPSGVHRKANPHRSSRHSFPLAMPPAKKEHPKAPGSNPIDWTMAPSWHHFPDPDPQARLFFLRDLPVIDTLRRVSIACGGKQ